MISYEPLVLLRFTLLYISAGDCQAKIACSGPVVQSLWLLVPCGLPCVEEEECKMRIRRQIEHPQGDPTTRRTMT